MTAEEFYDLNIALLTEISTKLDAINNNLTTNNGKLDTVNTTINSVNTNITLLKTLVQTESDQTQQLLTDKLDNLQSTTEQGMSSSFYAKIKQIIVYGKTYYKLEVYNKHDELQDSFLDENNVHKTITSAVEQAKGLNIPVV